MFDANTAAEIDRFREKLLDLTNRNSLLNYRKSVSKTLQTIDELPNQIFTRLVLEGKRFRFEPSSDEAVRQPLLASNGQATADEAVENPLPIELPDDPGDNDRLADRYGDDRLQTNLSADRLETVIKNMRREANTAIEETGVNYLYLALGMLDWREHESSERTLLSPLILIPVQIERYFDGRSNRYQYSLEWREEETQHNLCLAKRLENDFGLVLPPYEEEQLPEEYFEAVHHALCRTSGWQVRREALVGFFSFQKLLMYTDIDPENWKHNGSLSEDSLAGKIIWGHASDPGSCLYAEDYPIDEEPTAQNIVIVADADSSQHSALCDIAAGKNLVIEGPPGTGKSQTITNAIAAAMHEGKTVLFVAEKLAALEVVQGNLTKLGLGEFCLELHSDAASPRRVFESLKKRLDATYYKPAELEAVREELEQKKQLLADYLAACRRMVGPYKEPLYELMWRVTDARGKGQRALRSASCDVSLGRASFKENARLLESFAESLIEFGAAKRSAWWGFWASELNPNDCEPVVEQLSALRNVAERVQQTVQELSSSFGHKITAWAVEADTSAVESLKGLAERSTTLKGKEQLHTFLPSSSRTTASQLVTTVREARQLSNEAKSYLLEELGGVEDAVQALRKHLQGQLLPLAPQTTVGAARVLRSRLSSLVRVLSNVQEAAAVMESQGLGAVRTLNEFERAEYLYRLMRHPVVLDRTEVPEPLFLSTAQGLLQRARQHSETLTNQRSKIEKSFHLASLPDDVAIREVTKRIRVHASSWFRILSKDYRSAKNELAAFWRPGIGSRPAEWVAHLEQLGDWLTSKGAFETNGDYHRLLNDVFQGSETDWEQAKTLWSWVTTVQKRGLDHRAACELLSRRADSPVQVVNARKALTAELQEPELVKLLGVETQQLDLFPLGEMRKRAERLRDAITELEQRLHIFVVTDEMTLEEISRRCQVIELSFQRCGEVEDRDAWIDLDAWYKGIETDDEALEQATDWMETLAQLTLPGKTVTTLLSGPLTELCGQLAASVNDLLRGIEEWTETRARLQDYGELDDNWLALLDVNRGAVIAIETLDRLVEEMPNLPAWSALCRMLALCESKALQEFTAAVLDGQIEPAELAQCYRFTVLERIAESALWKSGPLKNFSRMTLENARQRFQELDRELLQLNRALIAHRISLRGAPVGNSRGRVGDYTEMGLIRHEIGKQRRHCRIRDLVRRAGAAVQALKPCFMMSPLSVAQFLGPDSIEFDLVIMDEASQIKPEDALGTVLRAKQLVVVGDPKQLPPTSFFDRIQADTDDSEATQFDNTESILEVAMKAFSPVRRLRWHYRSRHESLIHFSNDRFYDRDLVVFPSATGEGDNLGLRHHFVENGMFSGGGNVVEAEAVARAIIEHARERPEESLGVGTFNLKQSVLIQDWLDRLCEQDSSAREAVDNLNKHDERLFIKNLENLQGDERDIIFVSYTYGPDPDSGRVMNRFGPITGAEGWRRLNVLITRARRRIEVFSSMQPSDILGGPDKSLGVNAFKDYLEYCRTGRLVDRGQGEGEMQSPFEEAVARVIARAGLEVVSQVGVAGYFIDLGVLRPGSSGDFLLGIECDGATYHSSQSARDRDRLREEVIRSRGWALHRIWSTDWYLNQRHEEERLLRVIEQQLNGNGNV